MGWNGSGSITRTDGTRTGATTWAQADAVDVGILSADHDTHDEDIATAIENCVARDGQNSPSMDLPMAGYKHTNVGAAAGRTDYARASQVQDGAFVWLGTTGGSANAHTASASPAITAYAVGQRFQFLAGATNTSRTCTLNINGVGAVQIYLNDLSSPLFAGDLFAGALCEVVYAASSKFVLLNPCPSGLTSVVAVGSNQGTAAALIGKRNMVGTNSAATEGVVLQANVPIGEHIFIHNLDGSGRAFKLYPPSGHAFFLVATDTAVDVQNGETVIAMRRTSTAWTTTFGDYNG